MNIKILRLKNGDDIICDLHVDNETIQVNSPMIIWLDREGRSPKLAMDHWLPIQVIKDNSVTLKSEDILTEFLPNEQLEEYYINTITEINSVLGSKDLLDDMTDDELVESIIAMRELQEETIH